MLLSELDRKEKLKFLDLALHLAKIDGEATTSEKRLLNIMIAEVGDDIVNEYHFELSNDLNDTLLFFKSKELKIRRLVYYNLLRMVLLDELYNTNEHFFLEEIRTSFMITELKKATFIKLIYSERDLKEEIKKTINK